jgi:hypothetical protein
MNEPKQAKRASTASVAKHYSSRIRTWSGPYFAAHLTLVRDITPGGQTGTTENKIRHVRWTSARQLSVPNAWKAISDGIVLNVEEDGSAIVQVPMGAFAEWASTTLAGEFRQKRNVVDVRISPQELKVEQQHNLGWSLLVLNKERRSVT